MIKTVFTGLFTTLALIPLTITSASAANCELKDGWLFCTESNGHLAVDVITVKKGSSHTRLEVICDGKGGNVWESFGTWTKSENQTLANGWCDDYRG